MLGGKHYNYEHVLAKTRGLFSYQSNSLEKEKDKITANRAQRRVNCGWASSSHKPYRPLGTPDVLDKRKINLLKQNFARMNPAALATPSKGNKASKVLNTNGALDDVFDDLLEEDGPKSKKLPKVLKEIAKVEKERDALKAEVAKASTLDLKERKKEKDEAATAKAGL